VEIRTAADVAGYSRLMGVDEEGTHERLRALFREVVDPRRVPFAVSPPSSPLMLLAIAA
jgi:hypothetical protein